MSCWSDSCCSLHTKLFHSRAYALEFIRFDRTSLTIVIGECAGCMCRAGFVSSKKHGRATSHRALPCVQGLWTLLCRCTQGIPSPVACKGHIQVVVFPISHFFTCKVTYMSFIVSSIMPQCGRLLQSKASTYRWSRSIATFFFLTALTTQ